MLGFDILASQQGPPPVSTTPEANFATKFATLSTIHVKKLPPVSMTPGGKFTCQFFKMTTFGIAFYESYLSTFGSREETKKLIK
jgi:hypothetical protein